MNGLTLAGHTPVLYYDAEDEARDGCGFNVLYANGATADRYETLETAVAEFSALMEAQS